MAKLFKCIIVDDEEDALFMLENMLSDYDDIELCGSYNNTADAITAIMNIKPELCFLDIRMPQRDGFWLIEELHKADINTEVIFCTAYKEYIIKAIRSAAFDFLLKPVNPEDLDNCLNRLRMRETKENINKKSIQDLKSGLNNRIRINTRAGFLLIDPEDIFYCESEGSYARLLLKGMREETLSMNLKSLMELLPSKIFFRISRSAVINLNALSRLDRHGLFCTLDYFGMSAKLRVSRKYLKELEGRVGYAN